MKRYKIHTLGCKLNYAESSTLGRQFEEQGYIRAMRGESADLVVINSCAVTGESERKARELIRRAVRENQGAELVVTGCYAKLREAEIMTIQGVSRVESVKSLRSYSSGERTRSFLKVQDGCDYHCSYCTVWRARGESRSAPIKDVVGDAREIARKGVREIVLTGVNIGDFGRKTGETFIDLLVALDKVEGIERYRISSIEPNLLTDDIIAFCATSDKFMPHFHIPLQSGCDSILKRMGRRYTSEFFAAKVAAVRQQIPDLFIGVDVIVGFPGETDEDFQQTYHFLESISPSFLHVFPYSKRPNTTAAGFEDQVDPKTKKERVARLQALSDRFLSDFTRSQSGKRQTVLVEGRGKNGNLFGHTQNYIRVEVDGGDELINTIVEL